MYCQNCGVELENNMISCPLCGQVVNGQQAGVHTGRSAYDETGFHLRRPLTRKQRKFTWEIITIILGAGIAAAFVVDFIISGSITWSEYTTAIGLIIFCYVSVLAFWNKNTMIEIACGYLLSSICILALDAITGGISWALKLAIPLLLCVSIITLIYIEIVRSAQHKGINLIAYAFLSAALLCICTEGFISFFISSIWHLHWSIIVAVCVLPVAMVLIFVHFKMKKGQSLKRTFHI